MMNRTCLVSLVGLVLLLPAASPVSAPDGPGGVLIALKKAVAAFDEGDSEWLAQAFTAEFPEHVYGWTEPGAELDAMGEVKDRTLGFVDVGGDGFAWAAADVESLLAGARREQARGLRTTILNARASCDSETSSWVVADLERRYRVEGEERKQRVRVTAVMQYVGGEVHFRIWHWQASPLPEPAAAVRQSETTSGR